MTREKARATIVAEWLALHPALRLSEKQLAQFAVAVLDRHRFPDSGDPVVTVMAWLEQAQRDEQLVS